MHLSVSIGGRGCEHRLVDGVGLLQGDGGGQVGELRGEQVSDDRHNDLSGGELSVLLDIVLSVHGDLGGRGAGRVTK